MERGRGSGEGDIEGFDLCMVCVARRLDLANQPIYIAISRAEG